jgi:L-arabinonolactonase
MNARVSLVVDAHNILGEGILWCPRTQALYWTDIVSARLWRYVPATQAWCYWQMPERLACLALCEHEDWLLLGLASGLAFFRLRDERLVRIAEVEAGLPTRLNDGACDRQGRFVFGTLHEPPAGESRKAAGGLYRFNPDLSLQRLPLPGVAISNSIALSPDGKTLYYCDSPKRTIQCCDYGNEPGASRTFAELETAGGEPDGSSVDREGCLWNAQWGLGRIVRYTPDGRIDRVIDVPVSQPTRVAFGGRNLDTLYITSAREGLDAAAMQRESMAGGMFSVDPGVQGLPEPRFAGPPAHVMATT